MKPASALLLCATLVLLAACGGGDSNTPANETRSAAKSRLAAFDAEALDAGIDVPVLTEYWSQAEKSNGNIYPVKARVSDDVVLVARMDATGGIALRDGTEFAARSLVALTASLDTLARKHWNEERRASAAALILFADAGAPYVELLRLCRELVNLQVSNLWLVTRDGRDEALRLLPLMLDTSQLVREWYGLDAAEVARTALLVSGKAGLAMTHRGSGLEAKAQTSATGFPGLFAKSRIERVQFQLAAPARIGRFTTFVNELAVLGFADIEPWWPQLDLPEDGSPVVEARKLAAYEDAMSMGAGLDLPTLSDFWRAAAANRGLPAAGVLEPASGVLGLRAQADGSLATRAGGEPEWTEHSDDSGVLTALQRNAGEIDFDTGLSELQVVLAMDRACKWEAFLSVLEMLTMVRCHRLYVLTNDVVGPTLRLLNLHLPLGDAPPKEEIAAVAITREGSVDDGAYTTVMLIDGAERKTTGPRFSSSLTQWTAARKGDPKVFHLKMPRDEPFETLFTVLNAVAWLGMGSISFGG